MVVTSYIANALIYEGHPVQAPLQSRSDSDAALTDTAKTVARKRVIADNRPEAVAQHRLAEMMNNSPRVLQQRALSDAIHNSPRMVAQRQEMNALFGAAVQPQGEGAMPAEASPAQREEQTNKIGLPNQLKSGIESLSGVSMDHVTVHYNSDKPAQLQAHAYAQGSEIHLGAGQETHLPHEAWHVVQQAQGRVRPTLQMKAGAVNDDPALESEADRMGEKAAQFKASQGARNLVPEKITEMGLTQCVGGFSTTQHERQARAPDQPAESLSGPSESITPVQRKIVFGEGTHNLDAAKKSNDITESAFVAVQERAKAIGPTIILQSAAASTPEQAKFQPTGAGGNEGRISIRELPDSEDRDYAYAVSARRIATAHETQHALDHLDPDSPLAGKLNALTGKLGVQTELNAFAAQSAVTRQLMLKGAPVERKLIDMADAFTGSTAEKPTAYLLKLMKYYAWFYSTNYKALHPVYDDVENADAVITSATQSIADYFAAAMGRYEALVADPSAASSSPSAEPTPEATGKLETK